MSLNSRHIPVETLKEAVYLDYAVAGLRRRYNRQMSDEVSEVRKGVDASVAELHSKLADQDQLYQSLNQQLEDSTRKHDEHGGHLYAHSAQI